MDDLLPYDDLGQLRELVDAADRANQATRSQLEAIDAQFEVLRSSYRRLSGAQRNMLADLVRPQRLIRDRIAASLETPSAADVILGREAVSAITQIRKRVGVGIDRDTALAALGIEELRPGQDEAISAALDGRDALVVMATGSGKSLCYQVPALVLEGITLVVSPLIALMTDQVERLERAGASVCMLAATQDQEDSQTALESIARGDVKVVFCSPERFVQSSFLSAISQNRVDLFVVDEAHCLVEWGDNFRPEYQRLGEWRDELEAGATMALTATATPRTAAEIARRLGLVDPISLRTGFDRPNIAFDVVGFAGKGAKERKRRTLVAGLREPEALPAIVYCTTRREAESVADDLAGAGFAAVAYHAGLRPEARSAAQEAFMSGQASVICSTNAFGMGIDSVVRSVWHWQVPKSLEAYYQEAGRAGRDGRPARAVLLALKADLGIVRSFIDRDDVGVEKINALLANLRKAADADGHFGLDLRAMDDAHSLALNAAARVGAVILHPSEGGQSYGTLVNDRLSVAQAHEARAIVERSKERSWNAYHAMSDYAFEPNCRRVALLEYFGDTRRGDLSGRCCDICDPDPLLVGDDAGPASEAAASSLEVRLAAWRAERAGERPVQSICPDRALAEIARLRPRDSAQLAAIAGVGPIFLSQHAGALLGLIAEDDRASSEVRAPDRAAAPSEDQPANADLFARLRAWRSERAAGRPAYTVCPDRTLKAIITAQPRDEGQLAAITGVGPMFLQRHAESLLALLAEADKQPPLVAQR